MPRFGAPAISALIALLGLALPAQAAPAPIVFDFEDGLQGWQLEGFAARVRTQILGGEWAVFGEGEVVETPAGHVGAIDFDKLALISMEADLTEVVTISVDQRLLLDIGRSAILSTVSRTDGVITQIGAQAVGVPAEEGANPDTWTFDVSSLVGHHEIALWWRPVFCEPPCDPALAASFIDNITFHPVPEPGTLGLLAGSLVALVIARRWV